MRFEPSPGSARGLRLSWNADRAFVPASAMTRWPNGSKEIANGTVPSSLLTVPRADGSPPKPTPNASRRSDTCNRCRLSRTMSWQRDYLNREGKHLMTSTSPRYDDLNALFINCTLKPSPELSHTQGLIEVSAQIMRKQGVRTQTIRAVDHDIATGVWPDMTEHG